MTFAGDLHRAAGGFDRQATARIRRVALAAFEQINLASPVDKGTFRANWVVSFDTIDRSCDLSKNEDDFLETMSIAMAAIRDKTVPGTTIYICNSVPYAIKIENGYSQQATRVPGAAGGGVVDPAITVIKNKIASGQL